MFYRQDGKTEHEGLGMPCGGGPVGFWICAKLLIASPKTLNGIQHESNCKVYLSLKDKTFGYACVIFYIQEKTKAE